MAKSTGNIARVGDLLDAGVSPRALRYALISAHYRASLNYTRRVAGPAAAARRTARRRSLALAGYREERPDDPTLDERARGRPSASRPLSTTT